MADKAERDLIAGTIADIHDAVTDLRNQIDMMTDELNEKLGRLDQWKKRLAALESSVETKSGRRPRGSNLRAVMACLDDAVSGLSASEIREKTGLAWSSVQRVLSKNANIFVCENNLWRLRKKSKLAVVSSANGHAGESEE